jgi:hypothetical protein
MELKKVLFALLRELTDTLDLEIDSEEEWFIETIYRALTELEPETCPFKNYDCKELCSLGECKEGTRASCNREMTDI